MKTETPTPRTENALIDNTGVGTGKSNYVSADFARQLERELTAANLRADKAESELASLKECKKEIEDADYPVPGFTHEVAAETRLERIRQLMSENDSLKSNLAKLQKVARELAELVKTLAAVGTFRGLVKRGTIFASPVRFADEILTRYTVLPPEVRGAELANCMVTEETLQNKKRHER